MYITNIDMNATHAETCASLTYMTLIWSCRRSCSSLCSTSMISCCSLSVSCGKSGTERVRAGRPPVPRGPDVGTSHIPTNRGYTRSNSPEHCQISYITSAFLSPQWRLGFAPRSAHVEFMVDVMGYGPPSPPFIWIPPYKNHSTVAS